MVIRYILCSLFFVLFCFLTLFVSLHLTDSLPLSALPLELLLHVFELRDRKRES